MGRSLVIVVSDDPTLIQKSQTWGMGTNVSIKVYSPEQWNNHLEDKTFRTQLSGSVASSSTASVGATVLPFPGPQHANKDTKPVSTINDLESMAIRNAIFEYKGNLTEAAKALGIGRATLYRKVKQYNIDPSQARKRGAKAA